MQREGNTDIETNLNKSRRTAMRQQTEEQRKIFLEEEEKRYLKQKKFYEKIESHRVDFEFDKEHSSSKYGGKIIIRQGEFEIRDTTPISNVYKGDLTKEILVNAAAFYLDQHCRLLTRCEKQQK